VLDFVRTWLFPPACVACEAPGPALCARCAPGPRDAVAFTLAGVPAFALGPYDGALRRAIVAMKRGERDPLDAFARLLADRATIDGALIPLPTSRGRVLERGFDQSAELARRLAARRGVACAEVLEKRGAAQAGLGRRARLAAAERFRVRRSAGLPATATLLDDVCTTGATACDAVRVLAQSGVEVRRIVVLARTAAEARPEPNSAAAGR
jgi:predicted amidophosphoribosyltransferase